MDPPSERKGLTPEQISALAARTAQRLTRAFTLEPEQIFDDEATIGEGGVAALADLTRHEPNIRILAQIRQG